jgi:hypothetical protein
VNENVLKREISQIFRHTEPYAAAIEAAAALLSHEVGDVRIVSRSDAGKRSIFRDPAIAAFLESRDFPFRGIYNAAAGQGTALILCVGSWGAPPRFMQSLAEHVALEAGLSSQPRRREAA